MINSIGAGAGSAPAAGGAAPAAAKAAPAAAAAAPAAAAPKKEEPKKVESEDEDGDMGFGKNYFLKLIINIKILNFFNYF